MSPQVDAQVDEKNFENRWLTFFKYPASESSGGCYIALDVNVNVYRLILKNCLYSTERDSGCRNQASLRRNTPLRK